MTDQPKGETDRPSADVLVERFFERGGTDGGESLESLMDVAAGVYVLVTRSAVYFVDFDEDRMLRVPRISEGAPVDYLRRDGLWVALDKVYDCTVGRGLVFFIDLGLPNGIKTMRGPSTPVEMIVQLLA